MEKPYNIKELKTEKDIRLLDNLLTLLFSNLQEIGHRVSTTTPVAEQLKEGEIIFLDDGSGDRQLYAKIKNTLFRLPKITIDGALAGNSDNATPTEKAVKTYADAVESASNGYTDIVVVAATKFTDRSNATAFDFNQTNLTMDGNWKTGANALDFSSVVPAGATGIALRVSIRDSSVGVSLWFRTAGNTDVLYNVSEIRTRVANQYQPQDLFIPLPSSRKLDYKADSAIDEVVICVKGWFK